MLLFLDLCLELKSSYVGRKRRNQAKNKVKQNAVYGCGVDNAFLDVSAALYLQAVWTGTVCSHMQEVNICIPYHLPNTLVFAHASHSNSERNKLHFPLRVKQRTFVSQM